MEGDGRPPGDEQPLAPKPVDEQQLPRLVSAKQEEKDLIDKKKAILQSLTMHFLSDCQSVALVSRAGSVDWCRCGLAITPNPQLGSHLTIF